MPMKKLANNTTSLHETELVEQRTHLLAIRCESNKNLFKAPVRRGEYLRDESRRQS